MHPNQHWLHAPADIAFHQSKVRLTAINFAFVSNNAEFAILRIYERLAHPMHISLMLHAISDELRHGEHLQSVLFAELNQVGHPRHGAVFAHDFADNSCWHKPCHPREIDGSLGLAGAHQHSTFARPQRKDVSRTRQIRRPGCRINGNQDGARAIICGNAGRHFVACVNRLAERGAIIRRILRAHGTDAQVLQPLLSQSQAD